MEPDEIMRVVASPLPKAEDGAAAAIELIHAVKEAEPTSFAVLVDKENPRNWRQLLKSNESREGGPWINAYAELTAKRTLLHLRNLSLLKKSDKLISCMHN